jgi:RNA 2',3'-cyclic 3'-phosphodiesterase
MKRLFIAWKVHPNPELFKAFQHIKDELKNEKIRWVSSDNMHITLLFLGDTEETIIHTLDHTVEQLLSNTQSFKYAVAKFGVFKNIQNPTVLWFGIKAEETASLIKITLDRAVPDLGIQIEQRAFKPHLTLGRAKLINNKAPIKELLLHYENNVFMEEQVSEIVLYESILRPGGPEYHALKTYPLK